MGLLGCLSESELVGQVENKIIGAGLCFGKVGTVSMRHGHGGDRAPILLPSWLIPNWERWLSLNKTNLLGVDTVCIFG